jgi:hypothetical protein
MLGLIAYVPYAAVGYCVASLACDVWPTLRSQLSDASYRSSRHGLDGEWPRQYNDCVSPYAPRAMAPGDPGCGPTRNPSYCFNAATGMIEGSGPLNGVTPPPGTVHFFTDSDGRETARISISGDNESDILVCYEPGGTFTAGGGGPPPGDPGYDQGYPGDPGYDPHDPGGAGFCGPRRRACRTMPLFARAECLDGPARNASLRRKRARWG